MDRTVATGTGFVGQYPPEVAKIYESAATTPDDLLLFFHHVPYTYKLHDGKTVIQYLYDCHYEGAAQAAQFVTDWAVARRAASIPHSTPTCSPRLQYQAGHAIVWRDAIVQYFLKLSGIPDDARPRRPLSQPPRSRRRPPHRLQDHRRQSVGRRLRRQSRRAAIEASSCSAELTYNGRRGRFNIAVQYFDLQGGAAKFALTINGQPPNSEASWSADATLPTPHPHGDNSTRHIVHNVALKPGDTIRIEGTPDGHDPAALDYIEILPASPAP